MDVHLAVLDFDPEEDRRLALVHPRVAPRLFLFVSRGERRELAGIIQQGLQPRGAVGGLESWDESLEGGHLRCSVEGFHRENRVTVRGLLVPLPGRWNEHYP